VNYPLKGQYFSIDIGRTGDEYVRCGDQVIVVAQDEEEFIFLISEPSIAFQGDILLLPGGSLGSDEDPLQAANRELQEEIGYMAGELRLLCQLRPFSKYLSVTTFVCLARSLAPSRLIGDEAHAIITHKVTVSEVDQLISSGKIVDSTVIAALMLMRRMPHCYER
jgi:ADP-ribose diphosphatase